MPTIETFKDGSVRILPDVERVASHILEELRHAVDVAPIRSWMTQTGAKFRLSKNKRGITLDLGRHHDSEYTSMALPGILIYVDRVISPAAARHHCVCTSGRAPGDPRLHVWSFEAKKITVV
jgi:hypothetical protein